MFIIWKNANIALFLAANTNTERRT